MLTEEKIGSFYDIHQSTKIYSDQIFILYIAITLLMLCWLKSTAVFVLIVVLSLYPLWFLLVDGLASDVATGFL